MPEATLRHLELTAVYRKVPEGYIGFIEELPGANTQGRTLEETRANLRDAAQMVLEASRVPNAAARALGGGAQARAASPSRGSGVPSRAASRAP
jgi:predicted RNase H-like HicB family nuclease